MKRRTWLRLNDDAFNTRKMMESNTNHELEMIKQAKKKSRMDIIGQNGNTGEHYEELNRGNWWGLADDWEDEDPLEEVKRQQDEAEPGMFRYEEKYKVDGRHPEPDATGAEDDLPSAAEDCAKQRGNYEI